MGMWLHPVAHGFTASSATSCTKEVNFLGFSGDIALSGQAQAAVLLFVYAFVYLPHFFIHVFLLQGKWREAGLRGILAGDRSIFLLIIVREKYSIAFINLLDTC